MAQRVGDQILRGLHLFVFWQFHGRSGDHFRSSQRLIAQGAAERILHEQLLQLQVGEGNRQGLLVLRHRALGAHHFDGGQAANLDLLLGIGESLVGESQRFLLYANVLVRVDQIPVHGLNLINGRNDLQTEGYV